MEAHLIMLIKPRVLIWYTVHIINNDYHHK